MNKSRAAAAAAVADIDTTTLIPLAMMIATTNTGRPAQQNCKIMKTLLQTRLPTKSQRARC
jgi:hypothetical protein